MTRKTGTNQYFDQNGLLKRKLRKPKGQRGRGIYDEIFCEIYDEYELALSQWDAQEHSSFSSPKNYLRRTVYQVGRHVFEYERSNQLMASVRNSLHEGKYDRVPSTVPPAHENPFHWCLYGVLHDQELITRNDRSLSARLLLYAHLHNVPPVHLSGFFSQCGGEQVVAQKLAKGIVEPWHTET